MILRYRRTYLIAAFFVCQQAQAQNSLENFKTLKDTVFQIGDRIKAPQIEYDFGKTAIRPESVDSVKAIAEFMKNYPEMKLEIGNFTDSRGNDEYNIALSDKRAKCVFELLIDRFDILPSRLSYKGYGESKPLDIATDEIIYSQEDSDEIERLHQLNRRNELLVKDI